MSINMMIEYSCRLCSFIEGKFCVVMACRSVPLMRSRVQSSLHIRKRFFEQIPEALASPTWHWAHGSEAVWRQSAVMYFIVQCSLPIVTLVSVLWSRLYRPHLDHKLLLESEAVTSTWTGLIREATGHLTNCLESAATENFQKIKRWHELYSYNLLCYSSIKALSFCVFIQRYRA